MADIIKNPASIPGEVYWLMKGIVTTTILASTVTDLYHDALKKRSALENVREGITFHPQRNKIILLLRCELGDYPQIFADAALLCKAYSVKENKEMIVFYRLPERTS